MAAVPGSRPTPGKTGPSLQTDKTSSKIPICREVTRLGWAATEHNTARFIYREAWCKDCLELQETSGEQVYLWTALNASMKCYEQNRASAENTGNTRGGENTVINSKPEETQLNRNGGDQTVGKSCLLEKRTNWRHGLMTREAAESILE